MRTVSRLQHGHLSAAFYSWATWSEEHRRLRVAARRVLHRMLHTAVASAVDRWKEYVVTTKRMQHVMNRVIMTMKMGLERGLREKIPEIVAVEQVEADGPQLTEEGIEEVLEEIRPFLKMAGGTVELLELNAGGLQPTATLLIEGTSATINSVRVEIAQRLKRNFPTLANVEFEEE